MESFRVVRSGPGVGDPHRGLAVDWCGPGPLLRVLVEVGGAVNPAPAPPVGGRKEESMAFVSCACQYNNTVRRPLSRSFFFWPSFWPSISTCIVSFSISR
jgi:hypothetical protein